MPRISIIIICLCFGISAPAFAQTTNDTLVPSNKFKIKNYIIPSALIVGGIIGLESHTLKDINDQIQGEVTEHIDERLTIDDFSQYTPALSVYALNAIGVEGKHRFTERSFLLASAMVLTAGTVYLVKNNSHVLRPDGSSYHSFPSGHTATAFVGAEFLWQEYKDVSIWYGIAGYTVAAGTGIFRVYNNRHWFNDVMMGAGIGMLYTKLVYWLHPMTTQKWFKKSNHPLEAAMVPFYDGTHGGIGLNMQF